MSQDHLHYKHHSRGQVAQRTLEGLPAHPECHSYAEEPSGALQEWLMGWQRAQGAAISEFRRETERLILHQQEVLEEVLSDEFCRQWHHLSEFTKFQPVAIVDADDLHLPPAPNAPSPGKISSHRSEGFSSVSRVVSNINQEFGNAANCQVDSIEGNWTKGVISGSSLTLQSGDCVALEAVDATSFTIAINGENHVVVLEGDGKLHWSNGEIWERADLGRASARKKKKKKPIQMECISHLKLATRWDKHLYNAIDAAFEDSPGKAVGAIQGCCKQMTDNFIFNVCITLAILTNTVVIGIYEDANIGAAISGAVGPDWGQYTDDYLFTPIFCVEIVMRVVAEKRDFFIGQEAWWNIFDLFVVGSSIVDSVVSAGNFSFLRILRIFRILRVLRVLRLFRVFRELRLMVISIVSAMRTLIWAFVLLFILMYCFSICFLQASSNYLYDEQNKNQGTVAAIKKDFSGVPATMYSLLSAISGGRDWIEYARTLDDIGSGYTVLFCFYIIFIYFGVLNVLTGVFVESATQVSRYDDDLYVQQEMERNDSVLHQIERLFMEIDQDNSGTITWAELQENVNDPRVKAYFAELEMDVVEAEGLFKLLDMDQSGEVPVEEFVLGCMRLKGTAKSIDVATMMYEHKKTSLAMQDYFITAQDSMDEIRSELKITRGMLGDVQKGVSARLRFLESAPNVTSSTRQCIAAI